MFSIERLLLITSLVCGVAIGSMQNDGDQSAGIAQSNEAAPFQDDDGTYLEGHLSSDFKERGLQVNNPGAAKPEDVFTLGTSWKLGQQPAGLALCHKSGGTKQVRIFKKEGGTAKPTKTQMNLWSVPGQNVPPPIFAEKFVQVGDWRFGQINSQHFGIGHKDGKTSILFRSDGAVFENVQGKVFSNGMSEWNPWRFGNDFGTPTCTFQSDKGYIQIGDWRMGEVYADWFSFAHVGGKVANIYHKDQGRNRGDRKGPNNLGNVVNGVSEFSPYKFDGFGTVIGGIAEGCPGNSQKKNYLDIGSEWRIGETTTSSEHHLSIGHVNGQVPRVFLATGQIADGGGTHRSDYSWNTKWNPFRAPATRSGNGPTFHERMVQIGGWRIGQRRSDAMTIGHKDGKNVMVFYKNGSVRTNEQGTVDSDGMSSWNLWSLSDRNNPLCAFVSTRFLQVGDWRIGKTDHDILSIGHRNGKMVQLYSEHGGTGAALRTDEMVSGTSMSRYNPWKLPRGNVLQGTASGCTYDKFPSWSALKTAQAEYNENSSAWTISVCSDCDGMTNGDRYGHNPQQWNYDCQQGATYDQGSYSCLCNEGYRNSETGMHLVGPSDDCEIVYDLDFEIGYNSLKIKIANHHSHFPNVQKYVIAQALKKGSATESLQVHPGHGQEIHVQNGVVPSYTLRNLEPGRRYFVQLEAFDSNDNQVYTNVKPMNGAAVTHCGCYVGEFYTNEEADSVPASATLTGTPTNFQVVQEKGMVMFSFVPQSRCEEAYAFTRDSDGFTDNFNYLPPGRCSGNALSTGKKSMDDLRESQLLVGKTYEYCVRAVGRDYMYNPTNEQEPNLVSSTETCQEHTIRWEASVNGKVMLSPTSGGLPVEGVDVSWALKDFSHLIKGIPYGPDLSIGASMDTYIRGGEYQAETYDSGYNFFVKASPANENFHRIGLLKFSDIPKNAVRATLRLFVDDMPSEPGSFSILVTPISNNWDESIDYATYGPNQPSVFADQSSVLHLTRNEDEKTWVEVGVDVTSAVNGEISFQLTGNEPVGSGADIVGFRTRDSTGSCPATGYGNSCAPALVHFDALVHGTATTGKDGLFSIVINEAINIRNDIPYPLEISFSKQTVSGESTIDHLILCDNENTVCSQDKAILYLTHLNFEVPYVAIDATSVPFRGKVVVGGTGNELEGYDGCPIQGAEVCLEERRANGVDAITSCAETDAEGEFEVPATIGTSVVPVVKYKEHEFEPLDPNNKDVYDSPILIEADKYYGGHDFQDISKVDLFVDVVGGLCDLNMGEAEIVFSIKNCPRWERREVQPIAKEDYLVPASLLDVRVDSMRDSQTPDKLHLHIMEYFSKEEQVKTIDLREIEEEELIETQMAEPASSAEEEVAIQEVETDTTKRVRFQFDGQLKSVLRIAGDRSGNCTYDRFQVQDEHDEAPMNPPDLGCDSFHVLGTQASLALTMELKYEIIKDEENEENGLFCDIVSSDVTVRMTNSLGLSKIDETTWIVYPGMNDAQKQKMNHCNSDSGGCLLQIKHEESDGISSGNAQAIFPSDDVIQPDVITIGPPETSKSAGYMKFLNFNVAELFNHQACVVVDGRREMKELSSVSLPTYEPLLVIRDPPGGMSYASYQNIQTEIAIDHKIVSTHSGWNFEYDGSSGIKVSAEFCNGVGVALCKDLTDTEVKVGLVAVPTPFGFLPSPGHYDHSYTQKDGSRSSNRAYSGSFTTSWSYQTSDDEFAAGKDSDTFLVPNLNVKYTQVETIQWIKEACMAEKHQEFLMNVESESNKPALSFVSHYDVVNHIIPKFERIILDKQAEKNSTDIEQDALELESQIDILQNGLNGWTETLNEYESINNLDATDLPKTQDWFKGWVKDHDVFDGEPLPENHWSALLPEKLFNRAEALADVAPEVASQAGDLEETYTVEFSGGGGLMEFHLAHEHAKTLVRGFGPKKDNSNKHFDVGVVTDTSLSFFGALIENKFDVHYAEDTDRERSLEESREDSTEVSFVLGDGDSDDHFVVDIYTDPRYGTFLFRTTSGLSMCIHEEGTLPGAQAAIKLLGSPASPVLPDAPMVFQLQLQNTGPVPYRFELFADHNTNKGMLTHLMNGDTLTAPQIYDRIEGGQTIFTTLSVLRGPVLYEYDALELGFRLACDSTSYKSKTDRVSIWNKVVGDRNKIVFEKPCPKVYWANLDDGYHLNINAEKAESEGNALELYAFNPAYMASSFTTAISETRLGSVALKYRRLGDARWDYSLSFDDDGHLKLTDDDQAMKVDFSRQEDVYGYGKAKWEYFNQQVPDGTYELLVESRCHPTVEGPEDFNKFSDTPLVVTLDREPPKLYGLPLPKNGEPLWPGDEVVFSFSEAILCEKPYRFKIEVKVEGVSRVFDKDDLNIFCENNQIRFSFDQTDVLTDNLFGKQVSVELSGVKDVVGNPLAGYDELLPIEHDFLHGEDDTSNRNLGSNNDLMGQGIIRHSFEHAKMNLGETSVAFQLDMDTGCTNPLSTVSDERLSMEVAGRLGLSDYSRIRIKSMSCDARSGRVSARVWVQPVGKMDDESGTRRLAPSAVDEQPSTHVARKLLQSLNSSSEENMAARVSKMVILPGKTDQIERFENPVEKPDGESALSASTEALITQLKQSQDQQMKELQNQIQFVCYLLLAVVLLAIVACILCMKFIRAPQRRASLSVHSSF